MDCRLPLPTIQDYQDSSTRQKTFCTGRSFDNMNDSITSQMVNSNVLHDKKCKQADEGDCSHVDSIYPRIHLSQEKP